MELMGHMLHGWERQVWQDKREEEKVHGRASLHLDNLLNHLLDDLIEEGAGDGFLDLLLDAPVRCEIGDINSIGGPSTSSEHRKNTTILSRTIEPKSLGAEKGPFMLP
jgi:hypothetical protein